MKTLTTGWDLMRVVRLLAGLAILIAGLERRDWITGFLGILLAGLALAGAGCCGTGSCSLPADRTKTNQ